MSDKATQTLHTSQISLTAHNGEGADWAINASSATLTGSVNPVAPGHRGPVITASVKAGGLVFHDAMLQGATIDAVKMAGYAPAGDITARGTIGSIANWFKTAKPDSRGADFRVQLGVHLEEIVEMMQEIDLEGEQAQADWVEAKDRMHFLAEDLKAGRLSVKSINPGKLADALADQIVTATGVGQRAGMDMIKAIMEVDGSNYSKFKEDGTPLFLENGKIGKNPSTYRKADFTQAVTDVTAIRWKV